MILQYSDIRVLSVFLIALYAACLAFFVQMIAIDSLALYALGISAALFYLLVCSIGALAIKEWARLGLIYGNVFLALGFLILYYIPSVHHLTSIYLSPMFLIVGVFFNLEKVRAIFFAAGGNIKMKCVLCIDDDQINLKTVRSVLLKRGYSVLTTSSANEGLRIAKESKPDMVILDVIMPEMNGREVCRQLKENPATKDIPVVFLTVKDSQDDVDAEKKIGAAAHLTKPIQSKVLIETVQDILPQ